MHLETHITFDVPSHAEAEFLAWAASRSLKVTCIQLARGLHAKQVMLTLREGTTLEDALDGAKRISIVARTSCGARALRTKVEATWREAQVPCLYLEHHVGVRLDPTHFPELARIAHAEDAHLSRNAFKVYTSAVEDRFLTRRFDASEQEAASTSLARLLDVLAGAALTVFKVERERVLFDDAPALDAGWMEAG